jgi:hypothetical protein
VLFHPERTFGLEKNCREKFKEGPVTGRCGPADEAGRVPIFNLLSASASKIVPLPARILAFSGIQSASYVNEIRYTNRYPNTSCLCLGYPHVFSARRVFSSIGTCTLSRLRIRRFDMGMDIKPTHTQHLISSVERAYLLAIETLPIRWHISSGAFVLNVFYVTNYTIFTWYEDYCPENSTWPDSRWNRYMDP